MNHNLIENKKVVIYITKILDIINIKLKKNSLKD